MWIDSLIFLIFFSFSNFSIFLLYFQEDFCNIIFQLSYWDLNVSYDIFISSDFFCTLHISFIIRYCSCLTDAVSYRSEVILVLLIPSKPSLLLQGALFLLLCSLSLLGCTFPPSTLPDDPWWSVWRVGCQGLARSLEWGLWPMVFTVGQSGWAISLATSVFGYSSSGGEIPQKRHL